MRLPFSIAWRYLFTKQREPLEWFTTAVSLLGVAIGVGTMIAVVGVMDGLRKKAIDGILTWLPQIEVTHKAWDDANPDPKLLDLIRSDPDVAKAESIIEVQTAMTIGKGKNKKQTWAALYGVDRIGTDNVFGIEANKSGEGPIAPGEIVVSDKLTTESLIGREVSVTGTRRLKNSIYPVFPSAHLKVRGTFKAADREFQNHWAFIETAEARRLAMMPKGIDHISVNLRDPMKADEVKARLAKSMPAGTKLRSWTERLQRFFGAMRILKGGMLLVMLMTIIVAALNIIGTLTLIIIQKTPEIGILKAIGADERLIGRIFMFEGLIVGLIGAILGAGMGLAFLTIVKTFEFKIPDEFDSFIKTIPVEISWPTILGLMFGAIVICTLAAMLPARHAAKLRPVAALRC